MNPHQMTGEQALAILLVATAVADGEMDDAEVQAAVDILSKTTGIGTELACSMVVDAAETWFPNPQEQAMLAGLAVQKLKSHYDRESLKVVIRSIIEISGADGEFSNEETGMVVALMKGLGISIDEL